MAQNSVFPEVFPTLYPIISPILVFPSTFSSPLVSVQYPVGKTILKYICKIKICESGLF